MNARRHADARNLLSNHEEADTKIILYAADTTLDGSVPGGIHSSDSDAFVLALRRYLELSANVSFVTGKRHNRKAIKLQSIVQALVKARTAVPPALLVLSGADNACFSGHTKHFRWKTF